MDKRDFIIHYNNYYTIVLYIDALYGAKGEKPTEVYNGILFLPDGHEIDSAEYYTDYYGRTRVQYTIKVLLYYYSLELLCTHLSPYELERNIVGMHNNNNTSSSSCIYTYFSPCFFIDHNRNIMINYQRLHK